MNDSIESHKAPIPVVCIGGRAAGEIVNTCRNENNYTVYVDNPYTPKNYVNGDKPVDSRAGSYLENYHRLNLSIVGMGNICIGVHESLLVKDRFGVNLRKTYENVIDHYCKLAAELEEAKRYAAE